MTPGFVRFSLAARAKSSSKGCVGIIYLFLLSCGPLIRIKKGASATALNTGAPSDCAFNLQVLSLDYPGLPCPLRLTVANPRSFYFLRQLLCPMDISFLVSRNKTVEAFDFPIRSKRHRE
jgi:hypothetical protein